MLLSTISEENPYFKLLKNKKHIKEILNNANENDLFIILEDLYNLIKNNKIKIYYPVIDKETIDKIVIIANKKYNLSIIADLIKMSLYEFDNLDDFLNHIKEKLEKLIGIIITNNFINDLKSLILSKEEIL